jgi:signal peptidase I
LITDFYAYDCYITVPSRDVYATPPSNARLSRGAAFNAAYQSGGSITQFGGLPRCGTSGFANEGLHWVGDLIVETEINTSQDCRQLIVELVEAGIQYQCRFDLQAGTATLAILDGDQPLPFTTTDGSSELSPVASTAPLAGGGCSIRMSNCDDQILVWVNDQLLAFDGPTTFDAGSFRSDEDVAPEYEPEVHPLDASPIGVAVSGGQATINRIKVLRDKYYIADDSSQFGIRDYDPERLFSLQEENISLRDIQIIMARPELWAEYPIWKARRKVTFRLDEDQFFPMGDNSPESLDARCWAGAKAFGGLPARFQEQAYRFADASYVPRDLLVGKALLVFWPHPWNTPVPFTPNFDRFRLIR